MFWFILTKCHIPGCKNTTIFYSPINYLGCCWFFVMFCFVLLQTTLHCASLYNILLQLCESFSWGKYLQGLLLSYRENLSWDLLNTKLVCQVTIPILLAAVYEHSYFYISLLICCQNCIVKLLDFFCLLNWWLWDSILIYSILLALLVLFSSFTCLLVVFQSFFVLVFGWVMFKNKTMFKITYWKILLPHWHIHPIPLPFH